MKKGRLIGGIAFVFILGILIGIAGTKGYYRYWTGHVFKDPAARKAWFLQRLTKDLNLTPEQQEAIKPIIDEMDLKREAFDSMIRTEIRKNLDWSFSRMKEKLGPEQQQKLEQLRIRIQERVKQKKRKTPFF